MANFELDLTSYLFYKIITVVSTILIYRTYGRWFILFFIILLLPSPRRRDVSRIIPNMKQDISLLLTRTLAFSLLKISVCLRGV